MVSLPALKCVETSKKGWRCIYHFCVSLARENPALRNEWLTPVSEYLFPFPINVLPPYKIKQIFVFKD
jgi:hypothetical protein